LLLLYALFVNLIIGTIAYVKGLVSTGGYIVGLIVGITIFAYGGVGAYVMLCTFFALGIWFSKTGYEEKRERATHQEGRGRRGGRHALANCLVGIVSAMLIGLGWRIDYMAIVLTASFATALADTTSNELGQLYGKHPFNPTTFKGVEPGTEGAISIEGTLLGIAGAIVIAGEAFIFDMVDWRGFVAVIAGATLGNYIESVLSSTPFRHIGNELLNLLNTLMGGLIALIFYKVVFM